MREGLRERGWQCDIGGGETGGGKLRLIVAVRTRQFGNMTAGMVEFAGERGQLQQRLSQGKSIFPVLLILLPEVDGCLLRPFCLWHEEHSLVRVICSAAILVSSYRERGLTKTQHIIPMWKQVTIVSLKTVHPTGLDKTQMTMSTVCLCVGVCFIVSHTGMSKKILISSDRWSGSPT